MTVILEDGDYARDSRGVLREAAGKESVIQEILLRLKARRGCFPLDPELGSTLWKLDLAAAGEDELAAAAAQALRPMPEVFLLGVERRSSREDGVLAAEVRLRVGGEETAVSLG